MSKRAGIGFCQTSHTDIGQAERPCRSRPLELPKNGKHPLDGEAVRCGKDGKSDFDKLHSGSHDASVFLYAFDLIELDNEDLRPAPLELRKSKLEKLLAQSDGIRFSEHLDGDGASIFAHACKPSIPLAE